MFGSKLFKIMITTLFAVTLIGVVVLFVLFYFDQSKDAKAEPTIDEVLEQSVDTKEITTNLLSEDYVKISFKIQTDSKDAKEELEKRDFQVNNIVIQELAAMKTEDFKGKQGIENLEQTLKIRLNELLQGGKVVHVYTTSFILQ